MKKKPQTPVTKSGNPIARNFVPVIEAKFKGKENDFPYRLRVMSYNILVSNPSSSFYPYCKSEHLHFNYRSKKLVNEIISYKPDIVCLQEVDNYREVYCNEFSNANYDGVFTQRTGSKFDGCATFFSRDNYYLRAQKDIQFVDIEDPLLMADNVAQILILESLQQSPNLPPLLVVANTHLFWEPRREEVRVGQVKMLISALNSLLEQQEIDISSVPIVICGDFNDVINSEACKALTSNGKIVLRSAYQNHVVPFKPFTTHIPQVQEVIDHIWHNENMVAQNVLEYISKKVIEPFGGLPCEHISSDHICLVCDFLIK